MARDGSRLISFYAPIMLAATRFGVTGAVVAAAASGVIAGPLLPLDVANGTSQPLSDWTSRTGFFIAVGLVMAAIIGRLKAARGREIALAEAEHELERHKQSIIGTVSHEFRTPLTMIRGSIEFFTQPGIVIESAKPLVEGLDLATQRLDNLVQVVLAATGTLIGERRRETVTLRDLCEEIAAQHSNGKARVRFDASPGAELVECDRELIGLLLGAIIDNALRFSPADSPVDIGAQRVGDLVEIRVRDHGPGMSDADRLRAFEPFTQKDESFTRQAEGLGLGLFAARKTAELLDGSIELEAAQDGGTEPVITLPCA